MSFAPRLRIVRQRPYLRTPLLLTLVPAAYTISTHLQTCCAVIIHTERRVHPLGHTQTYPINSDVGIHSGALAGWLLRGTTLCALPCACEIQTMHSRTAYHFSRVKLHSPLGSARLSLLQSLTTGSHRSRHFSRATPAGVAQCCFGFARL